MRVESRLAPLWTVLIGTGMRLGEAVGVRWADIDIEAATLTVNGALQPVPRTARPEDAKWARTGHRLRLVEPKTAAGRRTIALSPFVQAALAERRRAQEGQPSSIMDLVFTTPRGTPLDPRNVSRAFGIDLESVGLRHMRIHDLRHTAASQMLAQGFTLDDVKRRLGHASIAMTSDVYGHLVVGRSREIADGLERLLG